MVCYHVRQSFHPDEQLTPEQVNKLGKELAMKITGGNNQFIVCTHTDEKHLHNHIIFNAVDIDCSKKFDNEYNSSFKIRAMSDEICLKHGLQTVENPKEKENTVSRDIWEDKKKGIDWKAILESDIQIIIKESHDLADFKKRLKALGYEVKGKERLSIKHPKQTRFMRTDKVSATLDYSIKGLEFAIRHGDVLMKTKELNLRKNQSIRGFIETADKSGGLEHWAKVQNVKEYIKTQNYMDEHGLSEYSDLAFAVDDKQKQVEFLCSKIKQLETDTQKSKALKTHIIGFAKTKKTYDSYQSTRFKDEFYNDHSSDILIHEASKQAFANLKITPQGVREKLPKVADLNANISALYDEKSELYAEFKKAGAELKEIQAVKRNIDQIDKSNGIERSKEI